MLEDSAYAIPDPGDYAGEFHGFRYRRRGGMFVYMKTARDTHLKLYLPSRNQRATNFFKTCRAGRGVAVRYSQVIIKFRSYEL